MKRTCIVNSMFSQDAGPPIFPTNLFSYISNVNDANVSFKDLNLEIYRELSSNILSYHLLACVFGGYVFSYPLSASLPFNEFPFEALPTLGLLLTLIYDELMINKELNEVCRRFGIDYNDSESLMHDFVRCTKEFSRQFDNYDDVYINMPSPASVAPGIYLASLIKKRSPHVRLIAYGNQINIPYVAKFALAVKAFDKIVHCQNDGMFLDVTQKTNNQNLSQMIIDNIQMKSVTSYPNYHGLRIVPYETSIGCTGRCNFCSERLDWFSDGTIKDIYKAKNIKTVVADIKNLATHLGLSGITFGDCLLNANSNRAIELFKELEDTDLMFSGSVRADRLDYATIESMRKAKFTNVIVGVETFSPHSVGIYNKGGKNYSEKAWRAIPALFESGIIPQMNILIGHPNETLEDVKRSIVAVADFAEYLSSMGIPFFDAPVGTVCINYPSKMYFDVMKDPRFKIVFHTIPQELEDKIPLEVANHVRLIPLKAIRDQVSNAEMDVDKIKLSSMIYEMWSKDSEKILDFEVSALSVHSDIIYKSWTKNNVEVDLNEERNISINKLEINQNAIFNKIIRDKSVAIKKFENEKMFKTRRELVSTLLTLSLSGVIKLRERGAL